MDVIREALETQRLELTKKLGLPENTTLEQMGILGKVRNFENHQESLHMHFIDRLRIITYQPFSDNMNWEQIHETLGKLIFSLMQDESDQPNNISILKMMGAIHEDDYAEIDKKLCALMGFPEGTSEEMVECVEKGMQSEKRHQIKNLITDPDAKGTKVS